MDLGIQHRVKERAMKENSRPREPGNADGYGHLCKVPALRT